MQSSMDGVVQGASMMSAMSARGVVEAALLCEQDADGIVQGPRLFRYFTGFQALGALFEIGHAMGAAEMPMAEATQHKGHLDPVFCFATVTVFRGACLRHGSSPRNVRRFNCVSSNAHEPVFIGVGRALLSALCRSSSVEDGRA